MSAIVGSARAQKGHWKSANSTIVTGATRLPHVGSVASIGTPASFSGAACAPGATAEAVGEAGEGLAAGGVALGETHPHAPRRQTEARRKRWFMSIDLGGK